jgi:hypothetical protein
MAKLDNVLSEISATKLSESTIFPILDEAWTCHLQPQAPVPCFVGAPGVGKTQLVYAWAAARGFEVVELNGSTMSPTDFVAYVPDDKTHTLAEYVHSAIARCCDPSFKGVLFIDELHQTHPEVQKPFSKTINQRMVGSMKLSDDCMIVTAGNRVTDKAGANRLLSMIANRVDTIPVEVNNDALVEYFISAGHPEMCAGFLMAFPYDEKKDFKPEEPAFFTPRSFERVAVKMKYGRAPTEASVASSIGPGRALEFLSFLQMTSTLPTLKDVMSAPTTCALPTKMDEQCAMVCMLSMNLTLETAKKIVPYAKRFRLPMQVLFLKLVVRRDNKLQDSKDLMDWLRQPEVCQAITGRK